MWTSFRSTPCDTPKKATLTSNYVIDGYLALEFNGRDDNVEYVPDALTTELHKALQRLMYSG